MAATCPEAAHYFDEMDSFMPRTDLEEARREARAQRCFCDDAFATRAGSLALAVRLWQAGRLAATQQCQATISLFTVVKGYGENGERALRPVWDERSANHLWQTPPWVPLGSPASWAFLDLSELKPGMMLHSAVGDMPSFLSLLRLPEKAGPYRILESVTAPELDEEPLRQGLPASGLRGPHIAVQVLVMGWSWAPVLASAALCSLMAAIHGDAWESGQLIYGRPSPQFPLEVLQDSIPRTE